MRLAPAILLVLFAAPALAQEPIPDTTAAWRYFPLEVGNVWEYHCFSDSCDEYERRSVPSDTLIEGRRYFTYRVERFDLDGQPTGVSDTFYLRFDTLTAKVEAADGRLPFVTVCPLDVPFEAQLDCDEDGLTETETSGGVREVAIGGSVIQTTFKEYATSTDYLENFVGGIGYEGAHSINGGLSLKYALVSGVEYGEPIVLSSEPGSPSSVLALTAYPNPTRGVATLGLTVPVPQTVTVEVFDALGRRVYRAAHAAAGAASLPLDGRAWKPGVYVVLVTAEDGARATARLVRQ